MLKKQVELSRTTNVEVTRSTADSEEVAIFSLNIDPINVTVAGCIGYLIKMTRSSIFEEHETDDDQKPISPFTMTFTMTAHPDSHQKHYPSIIGARKLGDECEARAIQQVRLAMLRKSSANGIQKVAFKDYSEGIKQKRLVGNHLRELHSDEGSSEVFEQDQMEDMEDEVTNTAATIRPAELSNLLAKNIGDKNIFWMKIVTLVILLVSLSVIGAQYVFIVRFKAQLEGHMFKVKSLKELESEIIYMK